MNYIPVSYLLTKNTITQTCHLEPTHPVSTCEIMNNLANIIYVMHTMCLSIILFSDCNRTYQNRPSILLYSNLKGYNIPKDGSSSALQTHHYGYGIKPIICFNKYITTEAPTIDITYLILGHGLVILFHSFGLWLFIQSLIWTATVKIKTLENALEVNHMVSNHIP